MGEQVLKKANEIMVTMRRAAGCSQNAMYGIKVPRNVEEAYQFDEENGNTLWADSIKKEMDSLIAMDVFDFHPSDYKFKMTGGSLHL